MKLSDRLAKIAEIIPDGARVADIGTDHGYLPIYLAESGKARHVILSDINAGPLDKALLNIAEYAKGHSLEALKKPHSLMPKVVEKKGLLARLTGKKQYKIEAAESEWDIRRGDGLAPIEAGEADVCVIAGMGGRTIRAILEADPEKTASMKLFVLQPRTEEGMLRAWLREAGWGFYRDCLVREGTFLCQIIAVVPPANAAHVDSIEEEERKRLEEEKKMKDGPIAPWAVTPNVEDVIPAGEDAAPKKKPLAEELTELCAVLGWDVSPLWILDKDPLAAEYLQRALIKEKGILEALQAARTPESAAKTASVEQRDEALKRLLEIASQGIA